MLILRKELISMIETYWLKICAKQFSFCSCAPKLLVSVVVSEEEDAWDFQVVLSAGIYNPIF